ncbi:VTT domain-containing protein [Pseudomonas sp. M30-35]|uniref:VTT domain-containing protein n=1 Tax=Pseudomonas sp. M30-35 TaxID=1981174 RepID=UPI000B3CC48A|nr:VTT domain-containing protein [Pseudomonas sp. M30-35]ARU89440.1 DedA family protein [Pseudomonas sp. M30-35]
MSGRKRILLVVLVLIALFGLFEALGIRQQFSLEAVKSIIMMHKFAGILLFVLLFALGNLIQIPGWIFLAAAVLALGRLWGGVATYVAACFSCMLTYLSIRYIGGNALREIDNRLAKRLLAGLDKHPLMSIIALRMLMQTLPALNYTLALSGVRMRHYVLGTLLGLPLPIALYCIFFDYLAQMLHIS